MSDTHDPFYVADKAKAISWKNAPVGSKVVIALDGPASKVRARKYGTQEYDDWDDGNPKFNVVLTGMVKGKRRSLWAMIPSNLFFVLGNAQDKAGAKFGNGGELTVEYVGEKPSDNPAYNAAKQYAADYVPPVAGADTADPWDSGDEPPF